MTSIGRYAFENCSSLNAVHISSIEAWCKIAFGNYPSNPLCYAAKLYLNDTLVTDLVIPDSVTSIGGYAFYGCSSLASITIPESVTSIGDGAFYGCSSLNTVHISSIEAWCKIAFEGHLSNPLCNTAKLYLNNTLVTDLVVPNSVTSIGSYAFYSCTSLTNIIISENVTSIGHYAFAGCNSLTNITIPDSVTSIGNLAFGGCRNLTSITIPDGVTSIGYGAFLGCISLTSITIPDGVTSIGGEAFSSCRSITSVYCKPSTPPAGETLMFFDNGVGRKIYVPTASVNAYKTAQYWSKYASDIVGYNFN